MFASLLLKLGTVIPQPYRILFLLAAIASVWTCGFAKGLHYEQNVFKAEQTDALAKQLVDAAKLNKELSVKLFDSEARQKAMEVSESAIQIRLDAALKAKPQYVSKDCEISDEVRQSLNDSVKNNWRSQK